MNVGQIWFHARPPHLGVEIQEEQKAHKSRSIMPAQEMLIQLATKGFQSLTPPEKI